ncbi:MAG TPA: aldo/keto reductase [Caldimonas sp.]|nr:aldo/keto reductase [Caldimonas sp.]
MVTFPGNRELPSLGLGTWRMGEVAARRKREVAAVRAAIDMGWRVIDTAEMYGEGGAESVVGEAIAGALRNGAVTRDELFVVSKVYPHNAGAHAAVAACERSLQRLGLDHLDCYLLHWRGEVPLEETVEAFEGLRERGRIRDWGVSNFDVADMDELFAVPGGDRCVTDQVYFSLSTRGPGFDLVPWLQSRDVVTMAYSPIDQGALAANETLAAIFERRGWTAAQLALAWLVAQPGVLAIPKATSEAHLRENLAARDVALDDAERAALDRAFAPPRRKTPLAMI